ncbi:putative carbohydrate-binding protein with CBM5 and CBM33 domain [Streptomyces achromogenes]|uniref:Carbohydrate-binding protein with CBM5 and CBM33 domain n=1 Tax=Streptomyces achromogenes TaxID=67255 RepID=A0ABU0Q8F7_STRAH|nr:lytic polysaccharide monooxygenase [Streptomyces achromogenes]MDQ0686950.1 putative carbohydrate-binding protein with CBM5 and CBM33 domain [Streptomyces achromogenes]
MPRTTAHRTAALATAVAGPLLLGLWAAGPAQAHGAPTDPVSRVYACSPEGGADAGSAACRAAVRAGGTSFAAWDNLRVADVNGRDRQTVPDGKLCSGGLAAYRGLDLARADWPSTRLTPGGTLRMTYASTIAHEGTFRLYLTKPGYDASKPLTWSDLPERPFAEVRNPALRNGAYRFTAKLPADRTGRQVLYTIWQNSSTPDTYYSCSDVVFPQTVTEEKAQSTPAARASAAPAPRSASPTPSPTTAPASAGPSASPVSGVSPAQAAAAPESTPVAADTGGSGPSAPMLAGGAATVLLLTGGTALTVRLRRR